MTATVAWRRAPRLIRARALLGIDALLDRVARAERRLERGVIHPAIEDFAQRLHRGLAMASEVVRQIELEFGVDHAAVAEQIVEAWNHDIDDFRAGLLERLERFVDDRRDFLILGRCAKQTRARSRGAPP